MLAALEHAEHIDQVSHANDIDYYSETPYTKMPDHQRFLRILPEIIAETNALDETRYRAIWYELVWHGGYGLTFSVHDTANEAAAQVDKIGAANIAQADALDTCAKRAAWKQDAR